MKKFKRIWAAILVGLGIQYARPPVMETTPEVPAPMTIKYPPVKTNGRPSVSAGNITNASEANYAIYKEAVAKANAVAQSDCFRDFIFKAKFTETNDLTNQQIYEKFSEYDTVANVEFFYGTWKQNYVYKTQGIDIGDGVVYANTFFISTADDLASLILHEAAHQRGHVHNGVKSTSVPYSMNLAYSACAK